jgi:hypothetical protein
MSILTVGKSDLWLGPRRYEKPDVATSFVVRENPHFCGSLMGANEKVGEFSSAMEPLDRCKKSIIRMNWSTASRLTEPSTQVVPVLSIVREG